MTAAQPGISLPERSEYGMKRSAIASPAMISVQP